MEHYIKLLTIFIWKLPCEIWDNLPQRNFFTYNRLTATMFEIFMFLTSPRIRQKDTFQDDITVYCVKQALDVYYVKTERVKFYLAWKIM